MIRRLEFDARLGTCKVGQARTNNLAEAHDERLSLNDIPITELTNLSHSDSFILSDTNYLNASLNIFDALSIGESTVSSFDINVSDLLSLQDAGNTSLSVFQADSLHLSDSTQKYRKRPFTAVLIGVEEPGENQAKLDEGSVSAELKETELETNDVMIGSLDFDKSVSESAQWNLVMPDNWDTGTIIAKFYWTASTGTADQTVIWGIQGRSYSNDEELDQAFGDAVTTSDSYIAANDLHISDDSSAITIANAGAGEFVIIKVYRDISDTLEADAKLLAVKLEYSINTYSD